MTFLKDLELCASSLQSVVGIDLDASSEFSISSLLKEWLQGRASLTPTWRHLFLALREIRFSHLADKMETYLKREAVEQGDLNPYSDAKETADEMSKGKWYTIYSSLFDFS